MINVSPASRAVLPWITNDTVPGDDYSESGERGNGGEQA